MNKFFKNAVSLCKLAFPVVVARLGIISMELVDTVMLGRYSTKELAYQGLAVAPALFLTVVSIGLISGTLVVVAQNFGQGHEEECGANWHRSLAYSGVIGLVGMGLSFFGEEFFLLVQQTPDMARGAGQVVTVLGAGLPLVLFYLSTASFLEGIKRPMPGMVAVLLANLSNLFFNWVFIHGNLGFEAHGATGAAASTILNRLLLFLGLVIYLWCMKDRDRFGLRKHVSLKLKKWRKQRDIGYGSAMAMGMEEVAFFAMTIMAGWLGPLPVAGFSICMNVISLTFMIAIGFGAATSVRVGVALGRKDWDELSAAGWSGFFMTAVFMLACGVFLYYFAGPVAAFYTDDVLLAQAVVPVLMFLSVVLLADGIQAVMSQALRGRGDVWKPTMIQTVSYVFVLLPGAGYYAFYAGYGLVGLFYGTLIGSLVSASLLTWRFHRLALNDRAPMPDFV